MSLLYFDKYSLYLIYKYIVFMKFEYNWTKYLGRVKYREK